MGPDGTRRDVTRQGGTGLDTTRQDTNKGNSALSESNGNNPKVFKVEPNYSVTTSLLIDRLLKGERGNELTDDELQAICSLPTAPQQKGYSSLQSAIRFCERKGIVWKRINKAGKIRCLKDDERIELAASDRDVARRRLKRGVRRIGSVDRKALSLEDQKRFDAEYNALTVAAWMSEPRSVKKIEQSGMDNTVDKTRLLELFRK